MIRIAARRATTTCVQCGAPMNRRGDLCWDCLAVLLRAKRPCNLGQPCRTYSLWDISSARCPCARLDDQGVPL